MAEISNLLACQIIAGSNDRKIFEPGKLAELAASIGEHGLAQPITVRPGFLCAECSAYTSTQPSQCPACGGFGFMPIFQIVAGERRFRAIRDVLGWSAVPCIIRADLDDEAASAIMLAENTGRTDLNPIEEATAYSTRMERFGWAADRVAEIAGVSLETVRLRLSLLKLIPEAQLLVAHGHLPIGHAAALAGLDNYRQIIALRIYQESKRLMTLADFRIVTSRLQDEQDQSGLFDLEAFFIEQAQREIDSPMRGKGAALQVPTRSDLPKVRLPGNANAGGIVEGYIADLLASGHSSEAATIGTIYAALVAGNFMRRANVTLTD